MKKFVTIVLALALVLSLCTVAFAANTYTDYKVWDTKDGLHYKWYEEDLDGVSVSFTSATEVKTDGKVTGGCLAYYTIGEDLFVECDKADAEAQIKVNGKVVYLAAIESTDEISYEAVGTKATVGSKCGNYDEDYYVDDDGKALTVIESGDDVYVADDGDVNVLVGKKVYACTLAEDDGIVTVEHKWATVEGKLVVDLDKEKLSEVSGTVVCKECGQKGTITDKFDKVPDNATWYYVDTEAGDVFVYWVEAADAAKDANGVESSKTFDAGVAMYVGLSLASVAGSAVVIGKKKEF